MIARVISRWLAAFVASRLRINREIDRGGMAAIVLK
jgi:hypothetical protein